jgi:hypothetical protein
MRSKQPDQAETQSVRATAAGENGTMPTQRQARAAGVASLKTIEVLLDYAILESAELGLPLVVYLLRMARLELGQSLVPDESAPLADGSVEEGTINRPSN